MKVREIRWREVPTGGLVEEGILVALGLQRSTPQGFWCPQLPWGLDDAFGLDGDGPTVQKPRPPFTDGIGVEMVVCFGAISFENKIKRKEHNLR